jgi:hypothetical protein
VLALRGAGWRRTGLVLVAVGLLVALAAAAVVMLAASSKM